MTDQSAALDGGHGLKAGPHQMPILTLRGIQLV